MADDYAGDTGTSGRITVGGAAVAGRIETADDSDWFAVSLVAGRTYEFTLAAAGASPLTDPYLELYDSAGGYLTFNDDADFLTFDSAIVFTAGWSGTYYLAAWGYAADDLGSYTLRAVDLSAGDDFAADPSTSGRVSVGGQVTGRVDVGGDADWFAVTLQAGVRYTITLQGGASGGGTLADPYFEGIYDAGGRYIAGTTNDDFGGSLDSQVSFTPPSSGTYYLSAAAFEGTGSYTLRVGGTAVADLPASTATTATLALGGVLRSTIDSAGDVDWVKVTLTAGRVHGRPLCQALNLQRLEGKDCTRTSGL